MTNGKILWVDDEVEFLKAHIIFLEKKGYEVITLTNGSDAIEECRQQTFDMIILDEMMPGLTGLETLARIKEIQPSTPIVMCTKSEEENIMDQAIGSKISDYLIKPINPNQVLLSIKKNIHRNEIVSSVTQSEYQKSFQEISIQIQDCKSLDDWKTVYKRIVHWELELSSAENNMNDILAMQKEEANNGFSKFIKSNYLNWVDPATFISKERPILSPDIFKTKVFPLLNKGEKVFFILIDNLRYDQWRMLSREIGTAFEVEEDIYCSILPTATQYARNAIFSGLMPARIAEMFPELWVDEDEEEGKNLKEDALIATQIERYRRKDDFSYTKINNSNDAQKFIENLNTLNSKPLNVVVFNFIDMLSHARTESKMVRELASDESAYRSITLSWLRHSAIAELFKHLSQSNYTVVLTTDHGSIRTERPIKIVGDRNTNTNLRYKFGKNLAYDAKKVFSIKDPSQAQLPAPNLSTSYVFAEGRDFFAYPNNYNYYVSYYKNTFQHGGISLEEMLVPLITLKGRR